MTKGTKLQILIIILFFSIGLGVTYYQNGINGIVNSIITIIVTVLLLLGIHFLKQKVDEGL